MGADTGTTKRRVNASGPRWTRLPVEAAAFLTSVLVLLVAHWDSITYWGVLNPDEAQAVANTARMLRHGYTWNAVDATTVGPLQSIVLLWSKLFGLDPSQGLARITAAVLSAVLVVAVLDAAWTLAGRGPALTVSAGMLVLFAGVRYSEFVHYNSELVPVVLTAVGMAGVVRVAQRRESIRLSVVAAIGICLGLVPFGKLQISPLALVLGAAALYFMVRATTGRVRSEAIFAFVIGGLVPAVVFLGPLVATGTFAQFRVSYLEWATVKVQPMTSFANLRRMANYDPVQEAFLSLQLLAIAIGFVAVVATRLRARRPQTGETVISVATAGPAGRPGRTEEPIVLTAVAAAVALFCVVRPGEPFGHYLTILPPFLVLFVAALWGALSPRGRRRFAYVPVTTIALMLVVATTGIEERLGVGPTNRYAKKLAGPGFGRDGDLLRWVVPHGGSLLVWGWMPQWYTETGLNPAAHETHTYAQIVDTRLRPWMRDRLLHDVVADRPEIVMDAVIGRSFTFNDPHTDSIASFPQLKAYVDKNYQALAGGYANPGCPTTWTRNDIAEMLRARTVEFSKIKADKLLHPELTEYSEQSLDDFSVVEDTCRDYWLLPDTSQGSVRLDFVNREAVRQVLLLNTRNDGASDRSSRTVQVTLFDESAVSYRAKVAMRAYPEWTNVVLAKPVSAVALQVDVLDWNGLGGGLNEVKVWR